MPLAPQRKIVLKSFSSSSIGLPPPTWEVVGSVPLPIGFVVFPKEWTSDLPFKTNFFLMISPISKSFFIHICQKS